MKRFILRLWDWFQSWFYYLILHRCYYYGFTESREQYMRFVAMNERDRLGRPLSILEIGSFRGHSAILWNDYGHVTCIDPWPDTLTYAIFRRNLWLMRSHVCELRGRSQDILPTLKDASFDLIYIDGDHSYEACAHDIQASRRLLREGGVLCGDDLKPEESGVIAAVHDYIGEPWNRNAFYAARYAGSEFQVCEFQYGD